VAFDVFISYASKDKLVADAVCARLEASGVRCWIAPRDIMAGTSYGEAIIEAIHGARVMVLVFSSHANASGHIPKEVERAASSGVAILPFRIEDVAPGKSLDYFIGSVHWLDAMTPPMEKHLDNLTATVQKLLPVNAGEHGLPAADISAMWMRSAPSIAPPIVPPATHKAAVRSTANGEAARKSSSKAIWIGLALVLLAAIVITIVILRDGGDSQSETSAPAATVPQVAANPPKQSTSTSHTGHAAAPNSGTSSGTNSATGLQPTAHATANPPSAPAEAPSPAADVAKASVDPIVGCYQWFTNAPVVIRADGTVIAGSFTARWHLENGAQSTYTIAWPEARDTVTIAPHQKNLSGANQYGLPASGTRLLGTTGLIGTWRWTSGVVVTVYSDGTFSAVSTHGKWRAIDGQRRIFELTWPEPVDSVTLSADGSHISGKNQYGVSISGVRTEPCAGN
jgi:hypothetical protein